MSRIYKRRREDALPTPRDALRTRYVRVPCGESPRSPAGSGAGLCPSRSDTSMRRIRRGSIARLRGAAEGKEIAVIGR